MTAESRSISQSNLASLVGAAYTWLLALTFGAVLLDTVYGGAFPAPQRAEQILAAFSEISDLLLVLLGLTLMAGIVAAALYWPTAPARNLFVASLLLSLLEVFAPALFSLFPAWREVIAPIGPVIRIAGAGSASLLALAGLYHSFRS